MSQWRRIAIERFPSLHRDIADAESIGSLWSELSRRLEAAYRLPTLDERFVADVYDYAHWCLCHRSIDVRTAVVLNFYEDLADTIVLRRDVARWLSQEDFDLLEFAWRYVLKDEATVAAFRREFVARKADLQAQASRHRKPEKTRHAPGNAAA